MNIEDRVKILQKLGEGTFGVTYLVENRAGRLLAMKAIDIEKSTRYGLNEDAIMNEIYTLLTLSSDPDCFPSIVCYHGYYRGKLYGRDTIAIFSYYVEGPTLHEYLENLRKTNRIPRPSTLVYYMRQLLEAVARVHEKGYAHRDIKPGNIVFDKENDTMVLIDFGVSCQDPCSGTPGTPRWMPPESFNFFTYSNSLALAQAHDIWSLGLVFYELANLRLPFDDPINDPADAIKLTPVDTTVSDPDEPIPASNKVTYLINQMLNKNWKNRPSTSQLLNYIKNINNPSVGYF